MSRTAILVSMILCILSAAGQAIAQAPLSPANSTTPPATVGAGKLDPAAVKPGVWYKRTPLPDAPKNPRMGYEGAWAYDPYSKVVLRWGGHNQGGGGEQNSEMWAYDPTANTFKLMEPNYCPPGACCNRDQVFDIANRRYVRFPSFSASHGWQWRREVYQMQSSVWAYDYPANQWRNMRPWPEPKPGPMRGAAYDTDDQVTVVCQGEGVRWGTAVYDLYTNTWTMMDAKNEPPERNTFGFAYDPVGKKFVSFGSQNGSDPKTWIYDLRRNEWQGLDLSPHPPEVKNGAVLAYDPFNKIMLCVAMTWKDGIDPEDKTPTKVPATLETWTFDPAKNVWARLQTKGMPDPSGVRSRLLLFDPDLNVFVLESRTKEQGEWIFRYADYSAPKDRPPAAPAIRRPKVQVNPPAVRLSSTGMSAGGVDHYVLYRGTGPNPWAVEFAEHAKAPSQGIDGSLSYDFTDYQVEPGKGYYYYVTAVDRSGRESAPSMKVRTQPPVIVDMVVSAVNAKRVELACNGPPADDLVSYNVYRAPVAVASAEQATSIRDKHKLANPPAEPQVGTWKIAGEFVKLTGSPVPWPPYYSPFTDQTVDLTRPAATTQPVKEFDAAAKPYKYGVYAYRVTAVNKLGVESGPSPYYLTIPGPVSDLKSRERKGETDLKWSTNKEKNIVGYRVYRLEGRFEDNKVTLLTPEPIRWPPYTDKIPNGPEDPAKRYYVVAVDSLGQEGIMGSPTWGSREYAKYYVGFLEEWHQ